MLYADDHSGRTVDQGAWKDPETKKQFLFHKQAS
jgi:hypothetical protein